MIMCTSRWMWVLTAFEQCAVACVDCSSICLRTLSRQPDKVPRLAHLLIQMPCVRWCLCVTYALRLHAVSRRLADSTNGFALDTRLNPPFSSRTCGVQSTVAACQPAPCVDKWEFNCAGDRGQAEAVPDVAGRAVRRAWCIRVLLLLYYFWFWRQNEVPQRWYEAVRPECDEIVSGGNLAEEVTPTPSAVTITRPQKVTCIVRPSIPRSSMGCARKCSPLPPRRRSRRCSAMCVATWQVQPRLRRA